MSVHEEPERPEIEIYREMLDHLEDIVFCHDPDGRFLFMSPAAEKFLGYRSEDVPGLDFAQIIASSKPCRIPSLSPGWKTGASCRSMHISPSSLVTPASRPKESLRDYPPSPSRPPKAFSITESDGVIRALSWGLLFVFLTYYSSYSIFHSYQGKFLSSSFIHSGSSEPTSSDRERRR